MIPSYMTLYMIFLSVKPSMTKFAENINNLFPTSVGIKPYIMSEEKRLKVYYGWAKINGIRKKRSLSIMFENDMQGCRSERGQRCLKTLQDTVIERFQTEKEEQDGKYQNRIFTEYSLFLDEKPINGSLKKLLSINSEADKNNVCKKLRDEIYRQLYKAFKLANPNYKDPVEQLQLNFE